MAPEQIHNNSPELRESDIEKDIRELASLFEGLISEVDLRRFIENLPAEVAKFPEKKVTLLMDKDEGVVAGTNRVNAFVRELEGNGIITKKDLEPDTADTAIVVLGSDPVWDHNFLQRVEEAANRGVRLFPVQAAINPDLNWANIRADWRPLAQAFYSRMRQLSWTNLRRFGGSVDLPWLRENPENFRGDPEMTLRLRTARQIINSLTQEIRPESKVLARQDLDEKAATMIAVLQNRLPEAARYALRLAIYTFLDSNIEPKESEKRFKIFFSHSRADIEGRGIDDPAEVDPHRGFQLAAILNYLTDQENIEVLRDLDFIPPGSEWSGKIDERLEEADAGIVILSEQSIGSGVVLKEVEALQTKGKIVIGVQIGELASWQPGKSVYYDRLRKLIGDRLIDASDLLNPRRFKNPEDQELIKERNQQLLKDIYRRVEAAAGY